MLTGSVRHDGPLGDGVPHTDELPLAAGRIAVGQAPLTQCWLPLRDRDQVMCGTTQGRPIPLAVALLGMHNPKLKSPPGGGAAASPGRGGEHMTEGRR
jgi:hypothetical protein